MCDCSNPHRQPGFCIQGDVSIKKKRKPIVDVAADKELYRKHDLFLFKIVVAVWCGFLAIFSWHHATPLVVRSDGPFWWKVFSALFAYAVVSIIFRMGWIVPWTVVGATLGTFSVLTPGRGGPLPRVEQRAAELSIWIPVGIVAGMVIGILLDHWWNADSKKTTPVEGHNLPPSKDT